MNNKPLELLIKEYRNGLYELTNNSGLPPCIIKMVADKFYEDTVKFVNEYDEKVIVDYYKSLETQADIPVDIPVDIDAEVVSVEG